MKKSKTIFCLKITLCYDKYTKNTSEFLKNLNMVKFTHFFKEFLAIAKTLPVRVGYRHDVTGGTTASTIHCYNTQRQIHCDGFITLRQQIEQHFHLFKPSVVFFFHRRR